MVAEVLREIGLLILTFIPVDSAFEQKPIRTDIFWIAMLGGLVLVFWGIIIERIRK
jgi:hypothetical protein